MSVCSSVILNVYFSTVPQICREDNSYCSLYIGKGPFAAGLMASVTRDSSSVGFSVPYQDLACSSMQFMLQIQSTTTRARTDPWHAIVAAELKADRFRAIGSTQDYQVMFGLLRSIWEQHVNEVRRRLYYGVFQLVSVLVLIVIFKLLLWRWHSCKWGLSGMWSAFFCSRERECGGERCSKRLIQSNT